MTGFNTQVGFGLYRIQIETDRVEVYKAIQKLAREFVDSEQTNKVDAAKNETPTAQGVTECSSVGADA